MELSCGPLRYRWLEDWAQLPVMKLHAHPGMVVSSKGEVFTGHADGPVVLILDRESGKILKSFELPVVEVHDIFLGIWKGQEAVFVVDHGRKPPRVDPSGQIVISDLDGKVLERKGPEDLKNLSEDFDFRPTSLVQDSEGRLWVANGYGPGKVFCYDEDWNHLLTIDGSNGAGPFKCPHSVYVDERGAEPRLYVADRANHRVQVFDLKGEFIKSFGPGWLKTPSTFAPLGDDLLIGELSARLVVVDGEDRFVGAFDGGVEHMHKKGWPNRDNGSGNPMAPADIRPGEFNSPHGVATDAEGSIYVAEWLLGGRYRKLERIS